MEVDELQAEVAAFNAAWHRKRGFEPTEQTCFNHLVEEVGELAHQFVNRDTGRAAVDDAKIDNAVADILIHLLNLAELRGLDIEQLLVETMDADDPRTD